MRSRIGGARGWSSRPDAEIDIAGPTRLRGGCGEPDREPVSREKVRKIRFFESSEYLSIDCLNRTIEAYSLAPASAGAKAGDWMRRIRPLAIRVEESDPLESELRHVLSLMTEPARSWTESETALEALRAADLIGRQIAPILPQGVPV
jgi:hypothetical protein